MKHLSLKYIIIVILILSACNSKENHFTYEIKSLNSKEKSKVGTFKMNITNHEWLAWDNQFLLEYLYDTINNGKIDSTLWEHTGYRLDSNHFYIHPPRSFGLEYLEYTPFPMVYFDKEKTHWSDTFTIPENSGWSKDLDNSVFYQEYEVLERNENEILIYATSVRGNDTSSVIYTYNFKNGFEQFDYLILDSIQISISKQ